MELSGADKVSLETTSWEEIWSFVIITVCPSGEASFMLHGLEQWEKRGGGAVQVVIQKCQRN